MKPVLTKLDFVERYLAGEFGNRPLTWLTLEDFVASGYKGLVHIRNRIEGGPTWYNIRAKDVERRWKEIAKMQSSSLLYLSQMGPEKKKVFQGEVMDAPWGLRLHYNTLALPMRDVKLEDWKHANGLTAKLLLASCLCPNSYAWMMELIERYLDHVIEFSTYSTDWGHLQGFNTVFWEVRKY